MITSLFSFTNGSYDPHEQKIICKTCGYIGPPETDIDMQIGDTILMCPGCTTLIGTVDKYLIQGANDEQTE